MNQFVVLVLVSLASYRLWRFVGADRFVLFRCPRDWVSGKWPGSWAAELIECPWCAGSWIAVGVTAVVAQFVSVELPVLHALAAATLVGLIAQFDEV